MEKIRPRVLLTILCLLLAATLPAHAAPAHIGKNHGKAGPSLPPVATPAVGEVKEETMVDWSFPAHLVQTEDWSSAALAYQQLAWQLSGAAKVEALRQVGYAQEQNGQLGAALQTYQNILMLPAVISSTSLTTEFSAKATATHYSRPAGSQGLQHGPSPRYLTDLLAINNATNPWSQWALQTVAWHTLLTQGTVPQTFGLPQLKSLQSDVNSWKLTQIKKQKTTTLLEAIPGAGLLYLNDKRAALGTFTVWLLALSFAVGTLRSRHYIAAICWWGILGLVMVSAPTLAAQRASQLSEAQWPGQLAIWKTTHLTPRPPEHTPQHISWIPNLPNTAVGPEPDYNAIIPAAGPATPTP